MSFNNVRAISSSGTACILIPLLKLPYKYQICALIRFVHGEKRSGLQNNRHGRYFVCFWQSQRHDCFQIAEIYRLSARSRCHIPNRYMPIEVIIIYHVIIF